MQKKKCANNMREGDENEITGMINNKNRQKGMNYVEEEYHKIERMQQLTARKTKLAGMKEK